MKRIILCLCVVSVCAGCYPISIIPAIPPNQAAAQATAETVATHVAQGTPISYIYVEDLGTQYRGPGKTVMKVVVEVAEKLAVDNPVILDNVEVGYTPKYLPIRIAVDSKLNVVVSAVGMIVTDVGAFDITASKTVISREKQPLLIIRVDDRVTVYRLESVGKDDKFRVEFSDKYRAYKILAFEREPSGNITLILQSLDATR